MHPHKDSCNLPFTTHAYTDDKLFYLTVKVTANDSTLEYVSVGEATPEINPDKVSDFHPSDYYVSSKTILNGKIRITVRYVLNGNVSYSYATLAYK